MKRVLAVSWEMPPMYGPRGTQVARTLGALVPLGWQPTVVCLDPRRGGSNWHDDVDVAPPRGVDVIRVKSPEEWIVVRALRRLQRALGDRPDSNWIWVGAAAAAAISAAGRASFDGLVTFAQPWADHLVGLRVHSATKLPWVAHFSDPWSDDPYLKVTDRRRAMLRRMEARVVAEASAIVFVSEETADLVMAKYPSAWRQKMAVIPHGFSVPPRLPLAARRPGPMRLVYTGRFYDGLRTPMPLLRALAQLNGAQPLAGTLDVALVGPNTTPYAADVETLGLGAFVHLRDRVSQSDAAAIAADADVLLVIDAPMSIPSPYLPSKLVDYLPLRKMILGITPVEGASSRLLKRLGALVAAPDDAAAIRDALGHLIRRWREGALQIGRDFDRVAAEYDIVRTTATFSGVLTRAFGGPA
jgi:hypothetical protein